ncbi:unnamed protein product [Notodromas monacha]|uniref:Uncharacterized protein n=1 Tax=Notodromas monacha TaxID=399045 RepID=A0A7R9BKE9_9CRUS|nr:unnamed protein product [Notodromas monacha]CAG0916873.1 unnamed protein product [Notodromas monacha]
MERLDDRQLGSSSSCGAGGGHVSWGEFGEQASDYSESGASSGDEAYFDREEELRGYHRAIDFTLHTIIEESCEESDGERRSRTHSPHPKPPPSQMEKYFYFDIGAGSEGATAAAAGGGGGGGGGGVPTTTTNSAATGIAGRKVPSKTPIMPQGILKKCRRVEPEPELEEPEELEESDDASSQCSASASANDGSDNKHFTTDFLERGDIAVIYSI